MSDVESAIASARAAARARIVEHEMVSQQISSDPISQGAQNFARDMPWYQQAAAGYGKAIPDLYSGVKQLLGYGDQGAIDEQKRLDAPLMRTGGGITGNIAGNMAAFAPTVMLPGANTLTGAAIYGAGQAALSPTETGGPDRGQNMLMGGMAGAAGVGLGKLAGSIIRPFTNSVSPEAQQIMATAQKEGIPLTLGQQTGSKPLQIAESVMENLPLTSGPQLAAKQAQQRAFTSAALSRAGIQGDVADAETLLAQKQNLGSQLGAIAEKSGLDFNQGLTDKLANIVGDASNHLTPKDAGKVSGIVDKILSQVDQSGSMLGTNYQAWREPLRGMAKEGGASGNYFGQIRKALDSEFASQAGTAYQEPARQYANLKTIIDAMGGPGNLPALGQIPPAQLSSALARSIGKESKTLGGGDLNDLTKAGQMFVRSTLPDSGTAQRSAIQELLQGNIRGVAGGAFLGSLAGGGAGVSQGGGMKEGGIGAGVGALAGGSLAVGGPRLAQMAMQNPALRGWLVNGMLPMTEVQRQALIQAMRLGTVSSVPALRANLAPQP